MGLFHHCSIGRLLAIVAILAVNIAAWRALSDIAPSLPFGFALSVPVLQVGLDCLVGSRGRVRGCWFGFVMAGLAAASSHIYLFVPGALFEHVWNEYTWRVHYFMGSVHI